MKKVINRFSKLNSVELPNSKECFQILYINHFSVCSYRNRLGIEVGKTEMLIHVRVMTGRKYVFTANGRVSLEKQFATVQSQYPLQTIIKDIAVHDQYHSLFQDISSVFPAGASCFMLSHPHYGAMGEVLHDPECLQKGRVKIQLTSVEEPNLDKIRQLEAEASSKYMSLFVACSKLCNCFSIVCQIRVVKMRNLQLYHVMCFQE